jgi:hypothetical protein
MYSPETGLGCPRRHGICRFAHPGDLAWKYAVVNRNEVEKRQIRHASSSSVRDGRQGSKQRPTPSVERNKRRPTPESLKIARSRQETRLDTRPGHQPLAGPSSSRSFPDLSKNLRKQPNTLTDPRSPLDALPSPQRRSRQSSSAAVERDLDLIDTHKSSVPPSAQPQFAGKVEVDQPNPSPSQKYDAIISPPEDKAIVNDLNPEIPREEIEKTR